MSFDHHADELRLDTGGDRRVSVSSYFPLQRSDQPFWNDEIDDVREVALFWLWIENGRPRLGHVADIMRRTRAKYHYTVRYTKRCENDRRKIKMAESVSTNNQRDLWLETKKLTSKKRSSTHAVDGACSPEDISEVFVSKYETLFQSTPTDVSDLQSINRDIRAGVEYDDKCYSSITAIHRLV